MFILVLEGFSSILEVKIDLIQPLIFHFLRILARSEVLWEFNGYTYVQLWMICGYILVTIMNLCQTRGYMQYTVTNARNVTILEIFMVRSAILGHFG